MAKARSHTHIGDILALRVTGLSNTINGTKAFLGGGTSGYATPRPSA